MGPLAGKKIIEMKGIGPGPYAGQILADLGAEVVVVERSSKPSGIALPSALDVNSRSKKSIAIDITKAQGLETLLKLVESADAIFESNRPGVAERLGFGPEVCLQRNPKVIYGRMTGWGQTGPLAHSAGHDFNYISLTGVAAAIGTQDKPIPPLNLIGDYAGGSLFLVVGILSALLECQQSGKGQVVDAAITDGSAHLMSMFYSLNKLGVWNTSRQQNLLDGGVPFYRAYETSDKKFMSVAPLESKFFSELVRITGLPDNLVLEQNNPKKWQEITSALEASFMTKTQSEWVELFEGHDACVTGVLDYQEAFDHPHNVARKTYLEVDGMKQPAPAPKFSRSCCNTPTAPSAEGADTKEVLLSWGLDQKTLDQLDDTGILN